MPIISVIVPVYKVEPYLQRCVDSILAQTFTDFELLLVDDGSPDNCPAICDEYARHDNRIKVIHKPNGGVSSARNAGLEASCGQYICFVDSDDYVQPTMLEKTLPLMECGYDVVSFGHNDLLSNGNMTANYGVFQNIEYVLDSDEKKMSFLLFDMMQGKTDWMIWGRIYRADFIRQYHLRFVDNINIAEDLCFNLCYYSHVTRALAVPEVYYNYRIRENSIMHGKIVGYNAYKCHELMMAFYNHARMHIDSKELDTVFPLMYLTRFRDEMLRDAANHHMSLRKIRKLLLQQFGENADNFKHIMEIVKQCKSWLSRYKLYQRLYRICFADYCVTGNVLCGIIVSLYNHFLHIALNIKKYKNR